MTARLKHQPFANPIKLLQKVLALFAHVSPFQVWATFSHYPYRVAAGVSIDAFECTSHK
jgi:hypothetical protein